VRWKTHESIGVAGYSILVASIYPAINVMSDGVLLSMSVIAYFASSLPDKIENLFDLPHRESAHSIVSTILGGLILFIIGVVLNLLLKKDNLYLSIPVIELSFLSGYLLHLLADSLTDNGIKWLWPYSQGPRKPIYRLWYYSEGEIFEAYITLVGYIITSVIWISRFAKLL
jgi:membrane-bound metal-dependent hydrolase YbcI (DUF457 family)